MKLFGEKSLSSYLFYISLFAALGSIILAFFILLSLAFGNYEMVNDQFQIAIPLFPELFIKGFYKADIISTIVLVLLYFSVLFYMLSLILKTFKSKTLFTKKAVSRLNYFGLLNIVGFPIVFFIVHFLIMKKSTLGGIHNLILSVIMGILVLFIAVIFKRGVKVQEENDLTI